MSDELKREKLWSNLRHYRRSFLEGLKEPAKNLRADRRWLRLHRLKEPAIKPESDVTN
jgi:hypothetical protein